MWSIANASLTRLLTMMLSCIIAVSFGLHTVELKHVHYGFHTDTHEKGPVSNITEYAHGTEKKAFVFVLMGIIASSLYVVWNTILMQLSLMQRDFYRRVPKVRSRIRYAHFLMHLFSSGILNPKYF